MDETLKMDSHLSSAAAFVEGGVQDACDDACSICLEVFCESDPLTVTSCKHEFHLQCILEWCQRSAQCPMCWQAISLKDPTSQELLEAVERERSIRSIRTRNSAILHHPTLGDFELQHLPVGSNDAELEERIIQHLAAAAAIGRAQHIARRDGQRGSSAAQGSPQFLLFSTHPNTATGNAAANSAQRGENELAASSSLLTSTGQETPHQVPHVTPAQADQIGVLPSGNSIPTASRPDLSNNRSSAGQSTPTDQDRAGPSDFQTFSETLKSRLNAVSTRYKDSITKSTRGWKERLFSRNNSVADLSSEVRREVNAGIATVSRMMERLDTRESRRASSASATQNIEEHSGASATQNTEEHSVMQPSNGRIPEKHIITHPSESNQSASFTAASGPN